MAENGARLLGADVALAVTGVGGPERQDDQSPGTVFLSLYHAGHSHPLSLQIAAHSPSEICHRTCTSALHLLDNHLTGDATTLPSGRTLQAPRSSERRH
jgi:nicotinamide-nucleotide amidase